MLRLLLWKLLTIGPLLSNRGRRTQIETAHPRVIARRLTGARITAGRRQPILTRGDERMPSLVDGLLFVMLKRSQKMRRGSIEVTRTTAFIYRNRRLAVDRSSTCDQCTC